MPYLLDANVFIQAKNREYGFDFCPAFWEWLDVANAAGQVFSVGPVRTELVDGNDDLADWARDRPSGFFLPVDDPVLDNVALLAEWARAADYTEDAADEFIGASADIYLLAYAMTHPHTVVTHEVGKGGKKKIKIPDVAAAHRLDLTTPYPMLRMERARFVLDRAA